MYVVVSWNVAIGAGDADVHENGSTFCSESAYLIKMRLWRPIYLGPGPALVRELILLK